MADILSGLTEVVARWSATEPAVGSFEDPEYVCEIVMLELQVRFDAPMVIEAFFLIQFSYTAGNAAGSELQVRILVLGSMYVACRRVTPVAGDGLECIFC
jgi:hypothetical protein